MCRIAPESIAFSRPSRSDGALRQTRPIPASGAETVYRPWALATVLSPAVNTSLLIPCRCINTISSRTAVVMPQLVEEKSSTTCASLNVDALRVNVRSHCDADRIHKFGHFFTERDMAHGTAYGLAVERMAVESAPDGRSECAYVARRYHLPVLSRTQQRV